MIGFNTLLARAVIDSLDRKRLWTCGKGVLPAVAEHALAMVLAMKRNLTAYARSTQWGEGVVATLGQK